MQIEYNKMHDSLYEFMINSQLPPSTPLRKLFIPFGGAGRGPYAEPWFRSDLILAQSSVSWTSSGGSLEAPRGSQRQTWGGPWGPSGRPWGAQGPEAAMGRVKGPLQGSSVGAWERENHKKTIEK